jgi:plastocyanin
MRLVLALVFGSSLAFALASVASAGARDAGAGKTYTVKMLDNKFEKKDIEIQVGDTVTWANQGCNTHTATSDAGTGADLAFDTKDVGPGKSSKAVTFKKEGKVSYYCKHHKAAMKGTITVKPKP